MKCRKLIALVLMFMTSSPYAASTADFGSIDLYLSNWDQFANGKNELVPYLREKKASFEANLATALQFKDKRAPARMVFYAVVQVGGGIEVSSELGRAAAPVLGATFPIVETKEGKKVYFAGDLFAWWRENRTRYESLALFDEWMQRDFAKQVVIPMYESAANNAHKK